MNAHPTQLASRRYWLVVENRPVALDAGRRFTFAEWPGLTPDAHAEAAGTVAVVEPHPRSPETLGLKNCSNQVWTLTLPDGEVREIEPGRSARLAAGSRLRIGGDERPIIGTAVEPSATEDDLRLRIGAREFSLVPGLALVDIDGELVGEPVAYVDRNPKHPEILGLRNISPAAWSVQTAQGEQRNVGPGETAKLAAGVKFHWSGATAEVARAAPVAPTSTPRTDGSAAPAPRRTQPEPAQRPQPQFKPGPMAKPRPQPRLQPLQKLRSWNGPRLSRRVWLPGAVGVAAVLLPAVGWFWFGSRNPGSQALAQLGSSDGMERLTAVRELGSRKEAASVSTLIAQTDDDEKEVRDAAIQSLAQIGAPAVPALVDALAGPEEKFDQATAADAALVQMGAAAVPELEKLLGDENRDRRRGAIIALGRQDALAYPALLRALRSGETRTQLAALETLPEIGPSAADATTEVAELLKHPDSTVRANAAYALAHFGVDGAAAAPALIAALGDAAPQVRASAAWALGEMAPAAHAAVEPLRRITTDPAPYVAQQAAISLRLIQRGKRLPLPPPISRTQP